MVFRQCHQPPPRRGEEGSSIIAHPQSKEESFSSFSFSPFAPGAQALCNEGAKWWAKQHNSSTQQCHEEEGNSHLGDAHFTFCSARNGRGRKQNNILVVSGQNPGDFSTYSLWTIKEEQTLYFLQDCAYRFSVQIWCAEEEEKKEENWLLTVLCRGEGVQRGNDVGWVFFNVNEKRVFCYLGKERENTF